MTIVLTKLTKSKKCAKCDRELKETWEVFHNTQTDTYCCKPCWAKITKQPDPPTTPHSEKPEEKRPQIIPATWESDKPLPTDARGYFNAQFEKVAKDMFALQQAFFALRSTVIESYVNPHSFENSEKPTAVKKSTKKK